MQKIAMKTVNYLPDFEFQLNRRRQGVWITKDDVYEGDAFEMTVTLFEFDGVQTVWIGMDLSGVAKGFFEIMQDGINNVTDRISEGHLYVNGTHTHSGPVLTKENGFGKDAKEDFDRIAYHCADLAGQLYLELKDQLVPFTSEIKVTQIEGCYSNRNSLDGPCDKAVTLIRFRNAETNEPIGMWMSMNCHSTMIFPRNMKMSSDLVGNTAKAMAKHYQIPVMPMVGAQGDTSTRLTRHRTDSEENDLKELYRIVNGVVTQVLAEDEAFEPINIDRFEVREFSVSFCYERDPAVTAQRLAKLDEEIATETNPDHIRLKNDAKRALSTNKDRTHFEATLTGHALNLGELKFGVFPGELVASLGLQVVHHRPHDHQMVVCYINDRGCGYLVEREEYGKNFESLSSIIPAGIPEVLTSMCISELEQFR